MKLKRILAVFIKQSFLIGQNKVRLISIFAWASLDIALWGLITKYLDSANFSNVSFVATIMGAVILWNFLVNIQHGIILTFFEDMWSRNFLNIFASPLSAKEYVFGLILTSIATSIASLATTTIIAWILFAYNIFNFGFYLIPFMAIIMIFGIALGVLTIGLILRFGPSAEWFAWIIPVAISPFAGIFYPISSLPESIRWIATILPLSYVFEGMRNVIFYGTFSTVEFFIGLTGALLYLILSFFIFLKIYKKVLDKGLFSRFTAENN